MSLVSAIKGLFRKKQNDDDMPYSIVMLLSSPFVMSKEVLEAAANKAYKLPYDGSHEMYFVVREPPFLTVVKVGSSAIKVQEEAQPYLGNPDEVSTGFRDERLRRAWSQHHAWVAFDLLGADLPKREAYRTLAALVAELLDARCAGIYLPKENQFTIQSDGSAANHLRSLVA